MSWPPARTPDRSRGIEHSVGTVSERSLARRSGAVAGYLLISMSVTVLVASILSNPWFSLEQNAISDLGRRSARMATVYDAGLVTGGLLFVFFLGQTYREQATNLGRVGLGLFGLTGIALLLIGLRSNGVDLPDSYALTFALTGGLGVLFLGVSMLRRDVAFARPFVGVAMIGTILAMIAIVTFDGLAVAELIAIAGYDLTIGALAIRLCHLPDVSNSSE